jgi:cytochrome c-type biogenesis protein CcmH
MSEEDFELLKSELEEDLLSNVEPGGEEAVADAQIRQTSMVLPLAFAVVVPLFAFLLYADWGFSFGYINDVVVAEELNNINQQAATDGGHSANDMEAVVSRLRERLKNQPENDEGWYMLARTLVNMGEYEEAASAFTRLVDRYPQDAALLSYQAESMYLSDSRQVTPRVRKAIDATLALQPDSVNVLEMLGMDAYVNGRYAEAIGYFERILAQDISADRADILKKGIAEAKNNLGESDPARSSTAAVEPVKVSSIPKMDDSSGAKETGETSKQPTTFIRVLVEIEDGLNVTPGDTVFVFARAVQGPPMPLAAQKLTVADLPTMVSLDDTMSMVDGLNISTVNQVQVVARVSKSGRPAASAGDYEALSDPLDSKADNPVIKLSISNLVQ